jgi:metal-sulfur cluster biosynthetic enzyme
MDELHAAILDSLSHVVDPETGADVVRMRLIEDLAVDQAGRVAYKFRPSSPLCPLAVSLAMAIGEAVARTPGVTGQEMEVVDYIKAEALTALMRQIFTESEI